MNSEMIELARAMQHEANNLRAFWAEDNGTSLHLNAADLLDQGAAILRTRLAEPCDDKLNSEKKGGQA